MTENRWLLSTPLGDFLFVRNSLSCAEKRVSLDAETTCSVLFFASSALEIRNADAIKSVLALRSRFESFRDEFIQRAPCEVSPGEVAELRSWLERAVEGGQVLIDKQAPIRTRAKAKLPVLDALKPENVPAQVEEIAQTVDECIPCKERAQASARALRDAAKHGTPFVGQGI